jgi:hypothetical protein
MAAKSPVCAEQRGGGRVCGCMAETAGVRLQTATGGVCVRPPPPAAYTVGVSDSSFFV